MTRHVAVGASEEKLPFPLGLWGQVENDQKVDGLRVERCGDTSFLVLTREGDGVFDTWLPDRAAVEELLAEFSVAWPLPGTPASPSSRQVQMTEFPPIDVATLTCPVCRDRLLLKAPSVPMFQRIIAVALGRGEATAPTPLKCERCSTALILDLRSRRLELEPKRAVDPRELPIKCPVKVCSGFVVHVAVPADHVGADAREVTGMVEGCAECGSIWKARASLEAEIRASVAAFPYRAVWYEITPTSVLPSKEKVPNAVYELIEAEPADSRKTFVRE